MGSVESKMPVGVTNEEVLEDDNIANETYCKRLGGLLTNGGFVCITLSLAMFWFMVCGAQTWMTWFLQKGVGASKGSSATYVMISNLTTPLFGSVAGQVIFNAIGGYSDPKAMPLCIMIVFVATLLSAPIPWSTSVWLVYVLSWFAQFVVIMFTPAAMAIMLL